MGVTPTTRAIVLERDGRRCLAETQGSCAGGLTMQHRLNRGMGGSTLLDTPPWLVTLCSWHNDVLERSTEWRTLAIAMGWKIERRSAPTIDPTTRPVRYSDGSWWLLTHDGRRAPLPF